MDDHQPEERDTEGVFIADRLGGDPDSHLAEHVPLKRGQANQWGGRVIIISCMAVIRRHINPCTATMPGQITLVCTGQADIRRHRVHQAQTCSAS